LIRIKLVDTLDLCTVNGDVLGLGRLSSFEYVAGRITDRETYVPVVQDIKRLNAGQIQF